MSFLDYLLTPKNPLSNGEAIITYPQSWGDALPWKKKKPFSYRAHQTKAGLYVVLPHHNDGSLFIDPAKKEETTTYAPGKHTVHGFGLQETYLRNESRASYLGSTLTKSAYIAELKMGTRISLFYLVNEQAIPICFRLSYSVTLDEQYYKKVSFEADRVLEGFISSRGPLVETNMTPFETEKGHYVDVEATLEKLVQIIKPEKVNPQKFFSLVDLSYVEQRLLH